jgi:ATP-dependent RNA helicase DDX18/HAS1
LGLQVPLNEYEFPVSKLASVQSMLFTHKLCLPSSPSFTPLLPQVPLNEYEFPVSKLASVQSQLERLVEKNYYLHQSARDAYRSYILAYNSHALKEIFNVHTLDLQV